MVGHLNALVELDDPLAMHRLAQCYFDGVGVSKNVKKARELAQRSQEIDPSLPPPFVEFNPWPSVLAVGFVVLAAFCIGLFVRKARRKAR
jgi:hypothetical protein